MPQLATNHPVVSTYRVPKKKNRRDDSDWSTKDILPQLPVFQEECKVTAAVDKDSTELDFFYIFFDETIIRKIKTETNRYAGCTIEKLKRQNKLKKSSLWGKWVAVKLQEMYFFLAIVLHMCVVKKPCISDYWSTDVFLQTSFAPKLMSRDRFRSIFFMLHVNDNSTYISRNQPNHDPLHKIRPIYDLIRQKCIESFYPNQNLTVDEGMCPFRGRVSFRVFMKNKPNKYGLKFYVLSDAESGYILNMELYTGKLGDTDNSINSLMLRLCENYLDKGHTIYMDRFYSSPTLFDLLWSKKTLAVGTVMKNKKELPVAIKSTTLKKDGMIFRRRKHLLAIKWKDVRDVYILSTKHKATRTDVTVKSKVGPIQKSKPDAVLDYNVNKTGVDRGDQMLSYYPFNRRSLKWWKKVFFHLIMMSITNSFVLYRKIKCENGEKLQLSKYIREIAMQLVEKGGSVMNEFQPATTVDRLFARHFPKKIPPTAKKEKPTRICNVCSSKSKVETGKRLRKETRTYCEPCGVALCTNPCFEMYHTKANFTK